MQQDQQGRGLARCEAGGTPQQERPPGRAGVHADGRARRLGRDVEAGGRPPLLGRLSGEAEEKGLTVGIIATDETKGRYSHGIVKSIGSREQEETIAHHLYEVLRDFDSCNVSAIYSEAFFTPRMGQAIMNRLLKAAGHKIINVEEEKENDSTGM